MSQDDLTTSLDDSHIRDAVRAAWGNQATPPALRHRVLMAMNRAVLEEPSIPETTRTRRFWDAWPESVRIAAGIAAVLLIAVGATWGIIDYENTPHYAHSTPDFIAPPVAPSLFAMLVVRHDDFSAGAEAIETAPASTQPQSLRDTLATRLHHAVWTPDLAKLGWKLTGVRVYPINGVNAVAFNFSRGSDSVSAFSLPVAGSAGGDSCPGTPAPDVDQLVDNRSFSSFSSDGQLYALVGSRGASPFPQAELRSLLTQFRDDLSCRSGCTP